MSSNGTLTIPGIDIASASRNVSTSAEHAYWRRKARRARERTQLTMNVDPPGQFTHDDAIRLIVHEHPEDFPLGIAEFNLQPKYAWER